MRVAGTASVAANQGIATATRRTSVRMVVTPGADHVVAGGVAARNLHLRLEQEKTEALAVNRVHPVSGDEPWCRPHSRSEERRVGEEGRSRWSPHHLKNQAGT